MFFLYKGERAGIGIVAVVGAALAWLQMQREVEIIWSAFLGSLTLYWLLLVAGLGLRALGVWRPVSLTLVAIGLFPVFSTLLALTGYTLFPLQRPLVDDALFAVDDALGYDWAAAVTWLAQYPDLSQLLRGVYLSSLPQLALLIVLLGLTGRATQLHQLVVTGMVAGVLVTMFWAVWPSFGPAAYIAPSDKALDATGLLVTPEYGATLMALAEEGPEAIGHHKVLGTVAFPSFHILMALLAVWFARGTWLFWPFLGLNILMVPATLTHGGHHLVDLPGGVVLFILSYWIAQRLVMPRPDRAQPATAVNPA